MIVNHRVYDALFQARKCFSVNHCKVFFFSGKSLNKGLITVVTREGSAKVAVLLAQHRH